MTEQKIRAVLFDFGGVLAEEGFRNGLQALAKEQGLAVSDIAQQGMQAVYDSGFVLGKGSAADFWSLLRQRTGLAGDDASLTARILDGFIIRPWMIALVGQLQEQGYVTAILSDQTHWLDELEARYHFGSVFDHIYNSYYLGKGKQDISLFADVAADLRMKPEVLLFVDDDPGNVQRARSAGWQAIHYIDREQFTGLLKEML